MRRRNASVGVREALATEYRWLSRYDGSADGWHARFADRIDAGESVEVHGYEVGMPACNLVRVEPDGTVVPVESGAR